VNGRSSTDINLTHRVDKPSEIPMDNIGKRHADRSIVLTKEDGQLQDGIRHIFAHISGVCGNQGI
jgi:hypothetical protein